MDVALGQGVVHVGEPGRQHLAFFLKFLRPLVVGCTETQASGLNGDEPYEQEKGEDAEGAVEHDGGQDRAYAFLRSERLLKIMEIPPGPNLNVVSFLTFGACVHNDVRALGFRG